MLDINLSLKFSMNIPNNEGKACDAVIRYLEKFTGETRTNIRHPEKEGVGPPVDLRLKLGELDYAIEHTCIESYEKQIKTVANIIEIGGYITERISDSLPKPACYQLNLPADVGLLKARQKRPQVLDEIVEWIRSDATYMREYAISRGGKIPVTLFGDLIIKVTPPEFGFEIELVRWPGARWPDEALIGQKPGTIVIRQIDPNVN